VLVWHAVSCALALAAFALFGWHGLLFFSGQALAAICLLETINYVEHYGLHRRKLEDGRYERTNHRHSWNSNFLLTNLFLFHLQRHSDHHAYAKRRYQVLRHFDDSPQLPNGYAGMIVLALFPPLVIRMLRIGENTGALDTALLNVSYFYNREVREAIGKLQAMIEPVLTVVLGLVLGWVMLAVLGPVYDAISKMKF